MKRTRAFSWDDRICRDLQSAGHTVAGAASVSVGVKNPPAEVI